MRVAVAGAGFAGLACAVDLVRAGVDVTVFEARDRVGGRVWSDVMPDGARFERGGEFIEPGYDHVRRRAAEHGLGIAEHGFEFAEREVRAGGQASSALLPEAERALGWTIDQLGAESAGLSAAEVIGRTPLQPLARTALVQRLEGTYTVDLGLVSASWLAGAQIRAGASAHEERSARLAGGNDSLARALASELDGRLRLGCPLHALSEAAGTVTVRAGDLEAERFDRAVLALPLPSALDLVPALRERASYARLLFGIASKLHVRLATPAEPAAVQGLAAAFWTWTAGAPDGGPATLASSFAGGERAHAQLAIAAGSGPWLGAIRALRPELVPIGEPVLTRWGDDPYAGGSYSCHPAGWSQRDDDEAAAPHGRVHLAGEHVAAEFSGTFEGALRSGARAAAEVLAERQRDAHRH
jgi:monoamine oxidase